MKKLLSSVSVILVLVMLLSMAAPMTASAAGDEITVKDLTAHIYNMEDTETLQCLFKSSMPDMAFISTVDFLKRAYVDEPSEVKNADGTYTITNPKGTMVIDPEHDTLHFDSFEDFVSAKENVDGTEMDVPYLKEHAPVKEGEINGLDLDLSPYKIDIIEYDGKTYFPATTLGLLFSATYNTAVYSEDNIYFIHCADIAMGNCYFKSNTAYETLKRSKDLVELTYNGKNINMDESSLSGFTTENSMSMSIKEPSINTCTSFEKYLPICLSKDLKKHIIKSIAQNLKGIIKENIQNNQMKFVIKSDIFYLNHFPPISIEDYINRIYQRTKMNISTLIISVIYIDRFCETNGYVLSLNNIHRIILAACLLSIKFNEDINLSTQYYASVAGVPVNDLNNLECYLYVKLKFSLFVEFDFYQKYFEYFCKNLE